MAVPAHAVTISRAAKLLGEDEELLWELATDMEPEDGCLWIHDIGEQQTIAFTNRGLENLQELVSAHKCRTSPRRS